MTPALDLDHGRLAALCRRHRIARLELFGSRAKGTARPDSDVDLLVTFEAGYTPGLEFFGLADEFAAIFGHPVDLVTRSAVERSPNPYKRASILAAATPIYVDAA
jgi:predicted nucleotidyltransferase